MALPLAKDAELVDGRPGLGAVAAGDGLAGELGPEEDAPQAASTTRQAVTTASQLTFPQKLPFTFSPESEGSGPLLSRPRPTACSEPSVQTPLSHTEQRS